MEIEVKSDEMYRVTSTYVFPYKEDLVRFDFEVAAEDEYMCRFVEGGVMNGVLNIPLKMNTLETESNRE